MASRMDRYSKEDTVMSGRSSRNKSLYKQIEDLDSYTNIAGVATIENKNYIDLEKVKELLKHGESLREEKKEIIKQNIDPVEEEEKRNYDIKELLSKVKENENEEEKKYRSLSSKQYELLKQLNERKKSKEIDEAEIDELVKTISNMKAIEDSDDVGLLDDLKSDTMVGDAASIKKIIDDEKELNKEFETTKIDKSFYTSSFGFTQRDFEELKDINHKIKKDNKKIIGLLITLIVLILGLVAFFLMK